MKILVTGVAGMVGESIKRILKNEELFLTDIENLDVRYSADIDKFCNKRFIDCIIHLAAETDLEFCEKGAKSISLGTQLCHRAWE